MRRSELSSASSVSERSSPLHSVQTTLQAHLASIYGPISFDDPNGDEATSQRGTVSALVEADKEDESGLEFRLFTKSPGVATTHTAATRVVVKSPTPVGGEPGFVIPRRRDSYYFTGSTSTELMEEYRSAAVTSQGILEGLKAQWVYLGFSQGRLVCLHIP